MTMRSWVFGANDSALGRGLNHLPFTAFLDDTGERRLGVGIGACVLDLRSLSEMLPEEVDGSLAEETLNDFMAKGPAVWAHTRERLQFLLSVHNHDRAAVEQCLLDLRGLTLMLPVATGDYTDFYASRHHARRVGELFRPEKPLLDNYDWLPIGYHGRASSLVSTGTPVRRPWGQQRGEAEPVFAPTVKLDLELELGFFIGPGNALGEPLTVNEAEQQLFGVSLLNDWSARDTQAWEYQPLGPFLGKSFCTSVSPWVTPVAALEPFRVPAQAHHGATLPYLRSEQNEVRGAFSLQLEVQLAPGGGVPEVIAHSDTRDLYWTPAQMVAHHTSGGCNLRSGDLLATGTISGPRREEAGCLLELTGNGAEPLRLRSGQERTFLLDGDEVILRGSAQAAGEMPVRLGECRGSILPARPGS